MVKVIAFSYLFLCGFSCFAQISNSILDSIIRHSPITADPDALVRSTQSWPKYNDSYSKQALQAVYHVLLAECYALQADNANEKSTACYTNALILTKTLNNPELTIWAETLLGFYHYRFLEYINAVPHFFNASQELRSITVPSSLIQAVDVYKKNAYFFGTIGDISKSIAYLKTALETVSNESAEYSTLTFSLGMNYHQIGYIDSAKNTFTKSLGVSKKIGDLTCYAKTLGELASIAMEEGDLSQAIRYLQEDIAISKAENSERNTMYAQIQLSKAFLDQGRLNDAKKTIQEASEYTAKKSYLADFHYEAKEILLEIARQSGDPTAELAAFRAMDTLRAGLSTKQLEGAHTQINLETSMAAYNWQLDAQNSKLEQEQFTKRIYIVFSVLLFILIIVLIQLYKAKIKGQANAYKKNILSYQLAREQSENKLTAAHNTLKAYQTYLAEKNTAIEKLEDEIETIKTKDSANHWTGDKKSALEEVLSSHLMTEENWNRFKQAFIQEQGDYYHYLTTQFPELSETYLRMILLQKIGLKNAEIARLVGITLEGVKKQKQRLRKKYEADFEKIFYCP